MQVGDSAPIVPPEPSGVTPDTANPREATLATIQDTLVDLAEQYRGLSRAHNRYLIASLALKAAAEHVHAAREALA